MRYLLVLISLFLAITSCRKDEKIDLSPQTKLQFSTDSVLFDTVFTAMGTTTRVLKIFNYHKKSVVISNISVKGGQNSSFKININGIATTALNDLKIKGNDSAYVFIKAFINPNASEAPFLIEDELNITLNGNEEKIPLIAYGQNANYFNNAIIQGNTTFRKGKPYIFFNNSLVEQQAKLFIEAGSRLYFHKNAQLFIAGSMQANGTLQDSITISSDRLERIYDDEAGQWKGLHFLKTSFDNTLIYTTLKNSLIGIRVDSLSNNNNPKLIVANSIIKNHTVAGILGLTASVTSLNSLYFNCGQFGMIGLYGGEYNFAQNTIANFNFNFPRKTPSVYFSNHLEDNTTLSKNLKVDFINNIIYGSLSNELELSKIGTTQFITNFTTNLIRSESNQFGNTNIYNQDPLFLNPRKEIYLIPSNSPSKLKGSNLANSTYYNYLQKDLKGNTRIFPSSLGCYE